MLIFFLAISYKTEAQLNKTIVSPLQTGHYMPGFMNIRDFADPAPISGIMVLDYNAIQTGNQFYGRDGKQITQITGPSGTPVHLNADVSGYYNTPMVLWASKGKVLGATYFGAESYLACFKAEALFRNKPIATAGNVDKVMCLLESGLI